MRALIEKIRKIIKDRKFRKIWYRGISATAAIVVFITTYALVLPAITMETEAKCGIPAHQHTAECYEEQLVCGLEETEGHHHTDDCYKVSKELTCTVPEHQHDESCFDEDGNLTCSQAEHIHGDTCYEEHRELTCGLEESEGHHHDSSCYRQVLTCGLEAHIHSAECYKEDSKAVTASTSAPASEDSDKAAVAAAASTSVPIEMDDPDHSGDSSHSHITGINDKADTSEAGSAEGMTANDNADPAAFDETIIASPASDPDETDIESEAPSTAATTDVLPEPVEQENLSEGYVPTLDPIYMEQVLDSRTGFYYYHAEEGEDLPASSADITSWKKADDNTQLAPADLVKAYFAYTIPAGTLNETNQIARCRLPANLHLTDDQILAINRQENGIAASYIDYDTLQILDDDNYHKYLGAEAIEGTRTPDQTLVEGTQEYISAVVKAENIYENTLDEDGRYIDPAGNIAAGPGQYLGQDLIFIFTPYTIEKNQITYDSDGTPAAAGRKVTGWFAVDFNMDQIDWSAEEADQSDNTTIAKTAEIVFAAEDRENGVTERKTTLRMVGPCPFGEMDSQSEAADPDAIEASPAEEHRQEEDAEEYKEDTDAEITSENGTEESANDTGDAEKKSADTVDKSEKDGETEKEADAPAFKDGTLTAEGPSYTVTLTYTADAQIPEEAALSVREITPETDAEVYKACLHKAKKEVADDTTVLDKSASRFFDIEIIADGKKVEPRVPVNVNIQLSNTAPAPSTFAADAAGTDSPGASGDSEDGGNASGAAAEKGVQPSSDPVVLHFAKHGVETIESNAYDGYRSPADRETDTLDSTGNAEAGTAAGDAAGEESAKDGKGSVSPDPSEIETVRDICFEADSFSIYGVVYTTITTTYISASGETYRITVTYDADAQIPEGARLDVQEITEDSPVYDRYIQASAEELGIRSAQKFSFARFFDIEIHDGNGNKVEPKTPVQVQITYVDALDLDQKEQLSIVHFADQGVEIIDNAVIDAESNTITYSQSSFSVTGTVVSGAPRNGQFYMLVAEYEGQKYIINNDGTLLPADDVTSGRISVEYPMLWTYYYQYGGHFRFASEASGFNANQTASGYYYRYLDPNSETGLTEENKSTLYGSDNKHLEQQTQINYSGSKISSVSNNNAYIGVSEEGGTLHVVGQQSSAHAAKITLYSADTVRPAAPMRNSVDHIDISIQGSANVEVSLAYGDYYYFDDDSNEWKTIHIASGGEKVTLTQDHIGITAEDMKRAKLTARDQNGQVVPNAYYITGYSANATTAYSTDQVRIEGSFKVSTNNTVNNWWETNSQATMDARLANKITYTVEAQKELSLPLLYEVGGKKVQLYEDQNKADPITINATVPLSAEFNYWMDVKGVGNECPPLQPGWGFNDTWKKGGIQDWGISGMDFVLHAGLVQTRAQIAALEIKKRVKDTEGHILKTDTAYTTTVEIYQDKPGNPGTVRELGSEIHDYDTYTRLHERSITVDNDKQEGHIYDYNVTDGMYYIKETEFPPTIQVGGQQWNYYNTVIKTEYVWRDNEYKNGANDHDSDDPEKSNLHTTSGVGTAANGVSSIPEVVGDYRDDKGNPNRNEFLVFYIDNIYSKDNTPPPTPVEKTFDIELDKKWLGDNGDTAAPEDGSVTFKLYRFRDQETSRDNTYEKTITVTAADGWKTTIPDLVWYESNSANSFRHTYRYYLEEDTSKATGRAGDYGVPSFTNGYGSVNAPVSGENEDELINIEAVNKKGNVITIQKRWINIDPDTAPNVTVRVWRVPVDGENEKKGDPELYKTITLTNSHDRVAGENWWSTEMALPSDRPVIGNETVWDGEKNIKRDIYGYYAYYLSEDNPDGSGNGSSEVYLKPRFYHLSGDEVVDDYVAYNNRKGYEFDFGDNEWQKRKDKGDFIRGDSGQDSTLIVMNAPNNGFQQVVLWKTWYKYDNTGMLIQATSEEVKDYAIGLQVYQRFKANGASWVPFANPFYIATDKNVINDSGNSYINQDNPFKFEYVKADNTYNRWEFRFLQYDGVRNGFPKYGLLNGNKTEYEYEVREIGVFKAKNGPAASPEGLTRVYDYANTKDWTFDEQHKDAQNDKSARGINVEAGTVKVTKAWKGGHVGSRIYFRVFCGNEDITESIVTDPESYGLTEHQVYDDDTHKALIVKSNGADWEELTIQGLPKAPAGGGGAAYQYSIQEIGYSEADGTDCWNGEKIINSDGSTRKDPHGNDMTVNISELLTGYQIDGGTETKITAGSQKSTGVALTGNKEHTITVNNTYVEKYKDLEITKVWQDRKNSFLTWQKMITVDLYANETKVVDNIPLYVIPPTVGWKQEFTWEGVTYKWDATVDPSGTIYTFKFHDLPAKYNNEDAVYEVREQALEGYTTGYGTLEDEEVPVPLLDENGKPVIDKESGHVVPKTDPVTHEMITVTRKKFTEDKAATGAADGKVIRNMKDEETPEVASLQLSKQIIGLTQDEMAKYKEEEFTYELLVNGQPYESPEGAVSDDALKVRVIHADKTETLTTITNGQISIRHGDTVYIPALTPGDTFTVAEEDTANMVQFMEPTAQRHYYENPAQGGEGQEETADDQSTPGGQASAAEEEQSVSTERVEKEGEITLQKGTTEGPGVGLGTWVTPEYKVGETDKVMFSNMLKEKDLEVEKIWKDEKNHDEEAVQFKVWSKIRDNEGNDVDYPVKALEADHSAEEDSAEQDPAGQDASEEMETDTEVNGRLFTLDKTNHWKTTIAHLPIYPPGDTKDKDNMIIYGVVEEPVEGYVANVKEITSSYWNIDAVKYWPEYKENRQDVLKIKLKKGENEYYAGTDSDGTATFNSTGKVYELNSQNNYTWRFPHVQKLTDGVLASYEIVPAEGDETEDLGVTMYQRDIISFKIENEPIQKPIDPNLDKPEVENHKTIDALRDGEKNDDTTRDEDADLTDLYRLYLDYKINSVQDPKGVDLLFIIDESGSMFHSSLLHNGNPNRAKAVQRALNGSNEDGIIAKFLDLNPENKWAAVGFLGAPGENYEWFGFPRDPLFPYASWNKKPASRDSEMLRTWTKDQRTVFLNATSSTTLTDYTAGFWRAEQTLFEESIMTDGKKKVVILLSDGLPTLYIPCTDSLADADNNDMYGSAYYPDDYDGCQNQTLVQMQNFINDLATEREVGEKKYNYIFGDNIELYAVGFGSSFGSSSGQVFLENLVKKAYGGVAKKGHFMTVGDPASATDSENLQKDLAQIVGVSETYSNIVIQDDLSEYVDLFGIKDDGTAPDNILELAQTKVTMTSDPSDPAKTVVLCQNGKILEAGKNILEKLEYFPNSKTVKAIFKESYNAQPGFVYTLSFDVKATEQAYRYYALNGYKDEDKVDIKGDKETDYGTNNTSSNKPGLHSNHSAKVSYLHTTEEGAKQEEKPYDHPVIQVSTRISIEKVDQECKPLENAGFNLYNRLYDATKSEAENAENKINGNMLISQKASQEKDAPAIIYRKGIPEGDYYLVESKDHTPNGYNTLPGPVKIKVEEDKSTGVMKVSATINGTPVPTELLTKDLTTGIWTLKVMNTSGYELPSTGGPGTRRIYILGCMLTLLAAGLLAMRLSMVPRR